MQRTEVTIPAHYVLRQIYALTGVLPLGLFLVLQMSFAFVLLLASKDVVQESVQFMRLPVVATAEICLITLPLLFHFLYGLTFVWNAQSHLHRYPYAAHSRLVLHKISGLVVLTYLLFHLYQMGHMMWNDMLGYQYVQTLMVAHQSIFWMVIFWLAMTFAAYYFCQSLLMLSFDWGLTASRVSQKWATRFTLGLFTFFTLNILFIVFYQVG